MTDIAKQIQDLADTIGRITHENNGAYLRKLASEWRKVDGN
jgi:hypothetical protein